jgi:hypothetical protein
MAAKKMVHGERLRGDEDASRIRFKAGQRQVTDGPFTETKELVAGFCIIQVKSKEEAIEWVKRIPNPDGADTEVEIRQVFEAEDFGPEFTSEAREHERRLRAELASR